MAGIQTAEDYIKNGFSKGRVIAKGKTIDKLDFMLIDNRKGQTAVYDYGSDIRFEKGIKLGDKVHLKIIDRYCAIWKKTKR